MKITVNFTKKEVEAIARFFSLVGAKETAESISKQMDEYGPFTIRNSVDFLTGNYCGDAECEEGYVIRTFNVLNRYAPTVKSTCMTIKCMFDTVKALCQGLNKDLGDVAADYSKENRYYGGFTTPSIYEKEVKDHVA